MDKPKQYKYIHFVEASPVLFAPVGGRPIQICKNNKSGDELGYVVWDKKWRTYVFSQATGSIIFNASCLRDIANFMDTITK